jgi:hypothetical protein
MTPAQRALAHLQAALADIKGLNPVPESLPGPDSTLHGAAYTAMTCVQGAIDWTQRCVDLGG